ncbi:MAG: hypothetical protein M0P26_01280 [Bacteroidales bacterium]|nr:hypothetical protein [Bacteroidales bacterium]
MEDYQKMIDRMINDGYCTMPDKCKAIYDINIYYQDLQEIMGKIYPDQSSDFSFAVFRAALYRWDLGHDSTTDYELYKLYLRNRDINELRSHTFLLPEIIKIKSNDEQLSKRFKDDIASPQKPFIISSFHYSSYKSLVNYLIYNRFTVYIIASNGIINQNRDNLDFYVKAMDHQFGKHSDVRYIGAEDFNSMLTLAEILSDKKIDPKTVFLLFPDGNIGNKQNIDPKRFEQVCFLGKELWVRKGVFMFAEMFNIPIYNVIIDSDIRNDVCINIEFYIENPKIFKHNGKNMLILFYNVLENYLLCGNLHKWECWVYIHSWHEHLTPPVEDKEFVSINNYDENRFTLISIKQDKYVFDSKYYISYPIQRNGTETLMDIILKTNVTL